MNKKYISVAGVNPHLINAPRGCAGIRTGVVCGVRVENIENPLMRDIRYLDKLVGELAKGKAMEKILRE